MNERPSDTTLQTKDSSVPLPTSVHFSLFFSYTKENPLIILSAEITQFETSHSGTKLKKCIACHD